VFTAFPFYFIFALTRPLAREEEWLAHIAELACGSFEAEEKSQEREKNSTSGVHGGGYFAPHDTDNNFEHHGRPITYLMGGSLVEVHSPSYFCLSHARTVFSCVRRTRLQPSAQGRYGLWWLSSVRHRQGALAKASLQFDISRRVRASRAVH
jgi:hypothetical protein